jgi:arylsulfatase A-like enzyme
VSRLCGRRRPRQVCKKVNNSAAVAVLGLLFASTGGCGLSRQAPPNILFLVIDSLRADHLGFAGYNRPTSPCLDSLAAEGVAFTRCYAQAPYTLASVPSLLTGLYPSSAHVETSLLLPGARDSVSAAQLGAGVATIASLLRSQGYVSAMINANTSMKHRLLGVREQFDFVDESMDCIVGECAGLTVDQALKWVLSQGHEPWICYIHFMDVHHPYAAPPDYAAFFSDRYDSLPIPRFDGTWMDFWLESSPKELGHVVGMYDAEIAYLDAQISRLLRELRSAGLATNLLVVVASDHGDELLEHGGYSHGHSLYEELTRCPLILSWPGHLSRGIVADDPVENIDIVPTILDLLGVEIPERMAGSSLLPTLHGSGRGRPVFSEEMGIAVRRGGWKLWQRPDGVWHLFDLASDPGETADLAHTEYDTLASLHVELENWWRSLESSTMPPDLAEPVTLDSSAVEKLRALGYVQ